MAEVCAVEEVLVMAQANAPNTKDQHHHNLIASNLSGTTIIHAIPPDTHTYSQLEGMTCHTRLYRNQIDQYTRILVYTNGIKHRPHKADRNTAR